MTRIISDLILEYKLSQRAFFMTSRPILFISALLFVFLAASICSILATRSLMLLFHMNFTILWPLPKISRWNFEFSIWGGFGGFWFGNTSSLLPNERRGWEGGGSVGCLLWKIISLLPPKVITGWGGGGLRESLWYPKEILGWFDGGWGG